LASDERIAKRVVLFPLRRLGDSRRRFHTAVLIVGALLTAGGLLGYALVAPEIPFASAPVSLVGHVRADQTVKVYGFVECNCTKAIDRVVTQVSYNGHYWNASYAQFNVVDPSGALYIDTDSVTRLTAGPTSGDWVDGDKITVYGTVYDQGVGNLALRAQMIAKAPDDTPAVFSLPFLIVAALGALSLAYVLTDRLVFGGGDE
jgi:hypothetical protein